MTLMDELILTTVKGVIALAVLIIADIIIQKKLNVIERKEMEDT
jgi:hypothetical protein